MESCLDYLNKACDKNEKLLKDLEAQNGTHKKRRSWLYLNPDLLLPQMHVDEESEPDTEIMQVKADRNSFITVIQSERESKHGAVFKMEDEVLATEVNSSNSSQQVPNSKSRDESLMSILDDPNVPSSVHKLISEKDCDNMKPLNEADAVAFCQYLTAYKKHLSESLGITLFKLTFYPVICKLEGKFLSGLLLRKIQEVTNKFPFPMMNGVIIPLITEEKLGKQTLDVICDIVNGLTEDSMSSVLKDLLTNIGGTSDNSMKLLTTIMDKKPKLDIEQGFLLVSLLECMSRTHSSNIHFGKMLLKIIPLLNNKLSEASWKVLKNVVENHKTFLKSQALNLFNKLTLL